MGGNTNNVLLKKNPLAWGVTQHLRGEHTVVEYTPFQLSGGEHIENSKRVLKKNRKENTLQLQKTSTF